MTAGLGPEPPFMHTPRLHEHAAAAQADPGLLIDWVLHNDNPPDPHRHPRTPGSGPISSAAIV